MTSHTPDDGTSPQFSSPFGDENTVIKYEMPRNAPSPYRPQSRQTPGTQYIGSEHSIAFNSPNSNHWAHENLGQDHRSSPYTYEYPHPEFIGGVSWEISLKDPLLTLDTNQSPYGVYGRNTPMSDRSELSAGDLRYQREPQWTAPAPTTKPRPKKKKKGDNDNRIGMAGDQPISILSQLTTAPIQDIERFVNRPIEARRKEVEGKNGYRPRPMNNFMLYRKAYQERAKLESSQSNHQIVSVVVAASWKNEIPEVKDKFAKYAQIEKDNHILAFPDYQFRPNKSAKAKKRKAGYRADDENGSDLDDDNDPTWGRGSSKRPRTTRQTRQFGYTEDYGYQGDVGPTSYAPPYPSDLRTAYVNSDLGKPPPMAVHKQSQDVYYNQRFLGQPYADSLNFDDTNWNSIGLPEGNDVHVPSQVSGLPGAGDALLNPGDFGPPAQYSASQVDQLDPLLVTENLVSSGAFIQSEFENLNSLGLDSGWEDQRPSLNGTVMPLLGSQVEDSQYDDEQLAQFLKSSS